MNKSQFIFKKVKTGLLTMACSLLFLMPLNVEASEYRNINEVSENLISTGNTMESYITGSNVKLYNGKRLWRFGDAYDGHEHGILTLGEQFCVFPWDMTVKGPGVKGYAVPNVLFNGTYSEETNPYSFDTTEYKITLLENEGYHKYSYRVPDGTQIPIKQWKFIGWARTSHSEGYGRPDKYPIGENLGLINPDQYGRWASYGGVWFHSASSKVPLKTWEIKTPCWRINDKGQKDSFWNFPIYHAYCAVCEGEVINVNLYAPTEAVKALPVLKQGQSWICTCPQCGGLENSATINHYCKALSANRYNVSYALGTNDPDASGYIDNSVFYHDFETLYNGDEVVNDYVIKNGNKYYTRPGYVMTGWSTVFGGEVEYEFGTSLKELQPLLAPNGDDASITLYAVWEPTTSQVKIDAGSLNGPAYYKGKREWVSDKTTYQVLSIDDNGDKGSKNNFLKSAYLIQEKDIDKPNGYTVTFDGNGGVAEVESITANVSKIIPTIKHPSNGTLEEWTYTFGPKADVIDEIILTYKQDAITLPGAEKKGETEEDGESFIGWYTTPDGKSENYVGTKGDTYYPTKNETLYAYYHKFDIEVEETYYKKDSSKPSWENNAKLDGYIDNDAGAPSDDTAIQYARGAVNIKMNLFNKPEYQQAYKAWMRLPGEEDWIEFSDEKGIEGNYSNEDCSYTFAFKNTAQEYEIKSTGLYELSAFGGKGGDSGTYKGGAGGEVSGKIYLKAGDIITVVTGGEGNTKIAGNNGGGGASKYGGGGGHTDVYLNGELIIIAGGGGGAVTGTNSDTYPNMHGGYKISAASDLIYGETGESGHGGGGGGAEKGTQGTYVPGGTRYIRGNEYKSTINLNSNYISCGKNSSKDGGVYNFSFHTAPAVQMYANIEATTPLGTWYVIEDASGNKLTTPNNIISAGIVINKNGAASVNRSNTTASWYYRGCCSSSGSCGGTGYHFLKWVGVAGTYICNGYARFYTYSIYTEPGECTPSTGGTSYYKESRFVGDIVANAGAHDGDGKVVLTALMVGLLDGSEESAYIYGLFTPDMTTPNKIETISVEFDGTKSVLSWEEPKSNAISYKIKVNEYKLSINEETGEPELIYNQSSPAKTIEIECAIGGYYYMYSNNKEEDIASHIYGQFVDGKGSYPLDNTKDTYLKKYNYTYGDTGKHYTSDKIGFISRVCDEMFTVPTSVNYNYIYIAPVDIAGNIGKSTRQEIQRTNLCKITFNTNKLKTQLNPTVTVSNGAWDSPAKAAGTISAPGENAEQFYYQGYYAVEGCFIENNGRGAYGEETGLSFGGPFPTPTAVGCTFKGWNTKPDGSGITYTYENLNLSVITQSKEKDQELTLYAIWNNNPTDASTMIQKTYNRPILYSENGVFAEQGVIMTEYVEETNSSPADIIWAPNARVTFKAQFEADGVYALDQHLYKDGNRVYTTDYCMAGSNIDEIVSHYVSNIFTPGKPGDVIWVDTEDNIVKKLSRNGSWSTEESTYYNSGAKSLVVDYDIQGTYKVYGAGIARAYVVHKGEAQGEPSYCKTDTLTLKIDKTIPSIASYSVTQDKLDNYKISEIDTAIHAGLFTEFTAEVTDYNEDSEGMFVSKNDSSGIYGVYVMVWDTENELDYKVYPLSLSGSAEEITDYDGHVLKGHYKTYVNTYADFPKAEKLEYKIYAVDYAGNASKALDDCTYFDEDGNEISGFPTGDIPPINLGGHGAPQGFLVNFSIKVAIFNDFKTSANKEVMNVIPDEEIYFQIADEGHVEVWTIGYVEKIRLDFEEMGIESDKEIAQNALDSKYALGSESYHRIIDIDKRDGSYDSLGIVDGIPYAAHYKDSGWRENGMSIKIPPYYELEEDGDRKNANGTQAYKPEIHSMTAYGIKGLVENTDSCEYILYDTIQDDVHYRMVHE